ncbi:MAG: T9SS type A sorting domain-containing protein [Bacteroidetes bacterium]|nr:T9SS type A sorting domain-containing protein [Bacteroidota bacterium]
MKTTKLQILVLFVMSIVSIQSFAQTPGPRTALTYDGVNDYVSGTGIPSTLTAFTIEAWVYHNTLPAAVQRYITISPEVAVLRYDGTIYGGTNALHFYIKKANGSLAGFLVANVLTTGTWMHIAGTYDGTTMKLYLNGTLLKSASPGGGLYPPSGGFSFSSGGSEVFNGKMDEMSIWDNVRSVTDIREDMYRTAPLSDAHLMNYWQFNNGTGTTVTDLKGAANGTLNNMNNTNWVASTIPFSAGAVNTQVVNATGTKTFTGTGLSMNFTATSGTDTIVASRIDTLPNLNPTGMQNVYNSQYWVVTRFGTGTSTANLTFTLNEDITPAQELYPIRIKLYYRNNNSEGAWTLVTSASSVNAADNTATFNGITSFGGQYIVCYKYPQNLAGTALDFDGINDYVNCGNANGLNIIDKNITIEAWINADSWNANYWGGTIVGKESTDPKGYVLRCGNNGSLSFLIGASGDWREVVTAPFMSTGVWYHVAATYDGMIHIYINGELIKQQNFGSFIETSPQPLCIGTSPSYPTRCFDGRIDEVRIWNVTRSQSQVQSDMLNTMTGTESGLASYWQFNEGAGTMLSDDAGSSNGTLVNMNSATCWLESYAMVVPQARAASNITRSAFTANWLPPAIGIAESYKLYVATDKAFTSLLSGYPKSTTGTSYHVTGLSLYTKYYYRLIAEKASLTGQGAYSNTVMAITGDSISALTGSGTTLDPFQIANLNNLNWLMSHSTYWNRCYVQTADINAAQSRNWDGGNGFSPIGNYSDTSINISYNGKGHIIDSIYINRPNTTLNGLFGVVKNAAIDSLSVTNVSIIGSNYCGGLVGAVGGNSKIRHCSSSGNISTSVNSNGYVGGLIGRMLSLNPDTIKYCYSSASVSSNADFYNNIGGFIGQNGGASQYITQCYATGIVFIDPAKLISNSSGGFAGINSGIVESSYWDIETTGQTSGGKSTSGIFNVYGETTAQMKTQSTFTGWNFTNNWFMSPACNNGYPCFYYAPEAGTLAASSLGNHEATLNGYVVGIGTVPTITKGFCWNTSGSPSFTDQVVTLAPGVGIIGKTFSANLSGLNHNTTYYVRAFIINAYDTVFGAVKSFTTTNIQEAKTCLNNGDQANYISVPDNSSLHLTNIYTIEAWIKPGVAVTTNRIIVSKGYNANGYTLLSGGSGNHRGLIFDGMATADNILTQNQWFHVAAVNDNGTRHLYLNGVEMPLTGTPTSVTANTQPLYLTNYYNDALIVNNLFRGYVEEVRLWNTAMTYSQIRENMHLPLTGSETGLVSYWQFDEGQPPTVYDKKGVNNGTWYASVINQYTTSTIPFGTGFSHTSVVNATGNYDFTNTGLSINFTAKSGLDSIVVAKIDTFPNLNPAGLPAVFDRQYWVVHKYGTGTLTANLTFTLSQDMNLQDQGNPSNIKLYTRSSMADDASWILLASATSVNAATNQATFEGITGFSQFILGKAVLVPVNQTVANTTIHNNETECFDATEVVSVSNFTVETGGDVTIIAGGQIHFTPGVVVQPGGYLHGYITTTDGYCISPAPSIPDVSGEEEETPAVVGESWFKLYPNPTRGKFTMEFKDVTRDEVQVTIYGIQGNKILQQKVFLEKSRNFCLDNAQAGIYIVRISTASETIFKKIVKL